MGSGNGRVSGGISTVRLWQRKGVKSRFLRSRNFLRRIHRISQGYRRQSPLLRLLSQTKSKILEPRCLCNCAVTVAFIDCKRATPLFLAFDTMYPFSTLHRALVCRRKRHEASRIAFHNVSTSSLLRPEEVYNTPGKLSPCPLSNTRQVHHRCSN